MTTPPVELSISPSAPILNETTSTDQNIPLGLAIQKSQERLKDLPLVASVVVLTAART